MLELLPPLKEHPPLDGHHSPDCGALRDRHGPDLSVIFDLIGVLDRRPNLY